MGKAEENDYAEDAEGAEDFGWAGGNQQRRIRNASACSASLCGECLETAAAIEPVAATSGAQTHSNQLVATAVLRRPPRRTGEGAKDFGWA